MSAKGTKNFSRKHYRAISYDLNTTISTPRKLVDSHSLSVSNSEKRQLHTVYLKTTLSAYNDKRNINT